MSRNDCRDLLEHISNTSSLTFQTCNTTLIDDSKIVDLRFKHTDVPSLSVTITREKARLRNRNGPNRASTTQRAVLSVRSDKRKPGVHQIVSTENKLFPLLVVARAAYPRACSTVVAFTPTVKTKTTLKNERSL